MFKLPLVRCSPAWLLLAAVALVGAACNRSPTKEREARVLAGEYTLSGPYTHENLTIYLILGEDQLKDKELLTLEEALEQKKVVVHETQQVNELAIENTSDEDVFVQSGDIIKGGQQDRVIASDLIVSAKSGKLPLAAFCVEQGRWSQRGGENVKEFHRSYYMLTGNELKIANRGAGSQAKVWRGVSKTQSKLAENVGGSVRNADSETSLQLSLEDKKVQEAIEAYVKGLAAVADKDDDVIGFAFAINGKMNSADVYASHNLFKRLWAKQLKASATEAVAELDKDKKFDPPDADAAKAFLADAEKGKATSKDVGNRFTLVQSESDQNLLFETRDKEQKDVMLRRNYLAK
jgi:hypothetical protein